MHGRFAASLVLLTVILTGCQNARHGADPEPPPQSVTTGSTFTVTRDFLIPSGDSGVYFQDSRLYPQGEIQSNYPFCEFSLPAATSAGQVIRSGQFRVNGVEYDEQAVGPGGMTVSVTELSLEETSSGKPYRMNCMLPLLSQRARFVSPAEIQGALGEYLNLKVAP
jgi:hypothetical protein